MDDSRNRVYGLVGLLVLVLLAVGAVLVGVVRSSDQGGAAFLASEVSPELRRATVDLIGYAPDGPPSLEDAVTVATRSVDDMADLDRPAYVETWGRDADAQAALVGRWLALATDELGGADRERVEEVTPRLRDATPEALRPTLTSAYDAATG